MEKLEQSKLCNYIIVILILMILILLISLVLIIKGQEKNKITEMTLDEYEIFYNEMNY